jgi:hypothetical protein
VDSSNSAAWTRSDGGSGTTMPAGGPGVWNSRFVTSIPAGATNISFKLDTFAADDKGVAQLNGTTIGDAAVQRPNGAAAGAGTFDFGLGAGNQPYNFVGIYSRRLFSSGQWDDERHADRLHQRHEHDRRYRHHRCPVVFHFEFLV